MSVESILCHAAAESGKVTARAVVRISGTDVSVYAFNGETHSTSFFNGVAVILPTDFTMQLPTTVHSAGCGTILREISQRIPESASRRVCLIPFA